MALTRHARCICLKILPACLTANVAGLLQQAVMRRKPLQTAHRSQTQTATASTWCQTLTALGTDAPGASNAWQRLVTSAGVAAGAGHWQLLQMGLEALQQGRYKEQGEEATRGEFHQGTEGAWGHWLTQCTEAATHSCLQQCWATAWSGAHGWQLCCWQSCMFDEVLVRETALSGCCCLRVLPVRRNSRRTAAACSFEEFFAGDSNDKEGAASQGTVSDSDERGVVSGVLSDSKAEGSSSEDDIFEEFEQPRGGEVKRRRL